MVVVVVAQQHGVDGRQTIELDTWQSMTARSSEAERAAARGPDGVGQDVGAGLLEEHGGMIHQRDQQRGRVD